MPDPWFRPEGDGLRSNTDISLGMSRLPVGDVIRIASSVRINRGWGSSEGMLYDTSGRFATVSKSLLVLGRRA